MTTVLNMPDTEEQNADALWEAFQTSPCEETALALVQFYVPLVRRVVRQMAVYTPPFMDGDDLMQHAFMGLWMAIDRFDPARRVPFEAYALRRVRGAVRDALRRQDPLSRGERELLKKLDEITHDHLIRFGKAPDEETLAEAAGLDLTRLREMLLRAQPWISLDAINDDGSVGAGPLFERVADSSSPDPRRDAIRNERAAKFRSAFRQLQSRQQKILYLYYFEDLTLKEIGAILELTEARICQLHAAALLALRTLLSS